jgi:RTX calcium-binding nonapeptide repeat (4 copies)
VRSKGGTVGLAMLALLVAAPAASASTASLADGGNTVVYDGDAVGDSVTLARFVDTDHDQAYYLVTDSGGITAASPCFLASGTGGTTAACPVTAGFKRYRISSGDGDDRVDITGTTAGGDADLGNGADLFNGLNSGGAADSVNGGEGNDTINGGGGDDPIVGGDGDDTLNGGAGADGIDGGAGADVLSGGPGNDLLGGGDGDDHVNGDNGDDAVSGGAGNDQVAGEAGNDSVDGGAGDDSLEFGGADVPAGVGAGADDLHGGDGVDLLSYNDHATAITLTLDGQPGDGGPGEGDNVHDDIETVIGTTLADTMTGDDLGQDLYGNGGDDTITGLGGDDLLNGGTGADTIYGGPGDDALEGSADGDYLDGGPGQDSFEGDNECLAEPCTGGSDNIQARDGEQDTVNCGVGADTATVDDLDIVAVDTQQGCESIDRAAFPGAPPGETTPPGPTMEIHGARGLRTLLKKGLLVYVTCPGAARIRGRLILRKTVVASARRTRITGGLTRLRVKELRAGKRLLKHRTKAVMTLVVDVTDSAGHKTTLSKAITFKAAKPAKKKTAKKKT